MIDENTLIKEIVDLLEVELPEGYTSIKKNFEALVEKDLMRASYCVLDSLGRIEGWQPSSKLKKLIIDYQVVF